MSTVPRFLALLEKHGSPVRYRRVDSLVACPCRTPEGFRDPQWHFKFPHYPGQLFLNDPFLETFIAWGFNSGVGTLPAGSYQVEMLYRYADGTWVYPTRDYGAGIDLPANSSLSIDWEMPPVSNPLVNRVYVAVWLASAPTVAYLIDVAFVGVVPPNTPRNVSVSLGVEQLQRSHERCNDAGFLPDPAATTDITVKGFVQPIQSTRATRLNIEILMESWGDIQADDHLAILPYQHGASVLNFYNWGRSGEDFVEYNGRRFTTVNANKIPDPSDGNPNHHWELGLRLINSEEIT